MLSITSAFAENAGAQVHQAVTYTLRAIEDFPRLEVPGFVPFYIDETRQALAINSVQYPDTFAAAEAVWQGETGIYNVVIHTVPENDGENLYRLHVNGRLVGEFTNPKVPVQWGLAIHAWPAIEIHSGDVIRVTANNGSNGVVPEGEGFAYARGRWTQLYLVKLRDI
jgi:hypothetical protein